MFLARYVSPVPGVQIVERGGKCTPRKLGGWGTRGGGWGAFGESKRTPVNIVNKGSFRYTGFEHTLLLVDYDKFC